MNLGSRNRASRIEPLLGAIALSFASASALAQEDLTLPPQIGDSAVPAAQHRSGAAPPRTLAGNPAATGDITETGPGGADLAAEPKARANALEEVIVVGSSSQWRLPKLPDLGSSWRQAHARDEGAGRIHVGVTSLYNPSESPTASDIFLANREYQRVGFLQLFQVHFGGGHRR